MLSEVETPVLGTGYLPGAQRFCKFIEIGTPINLVPEPDNPYDKNAIAVFIEDTKIGYVPNKGYSCSECWGSVDNRTFLCKKCGSDQVIGGGLATRLINCKAIEKNAQGYISDNLGDNVHNPMKIKIIIPIEDPSSI